MSAFLEVSLVSNCVHDCTYCPQAQLVKAYGNSERYLSFENFKFALSKLPPHSTISFAGFSEPTSNPEWVEMVLYAHEQCHEVMLLTTLFGMTQSDFERIRHIPWGHFSIHLPDSDGKSDIQITEQYIELLEYIMNNPPNGVFLYNHHSGDVTQEIKHLIPHSHLLEINSRADNLDCDDENVKHCYKTGQIVCGHRFLNGNSGLMLPNGDIQLCCSDFGLEYKLGNLLTDSWQDIQNSRVIKNVILDNDNGNDTVCRRCWLAKEI